MCAVVVVGGGADASCGVLSAMDVGVEVMGVMEDGLSEGESVCAEGSGVRGSLVVCKWIVVQVLCVHVACDVQGSSGIGGEQVERAWGLLWDGGWGGKGSMDGASIDIAVLRRRSQQNNEQNVHE